MDRSDYIVGQQVARQGYPFYALIQAAMRQADTDNANLLRDAWPHVWRELIERYGAPGGYLPGETPNEDAPFHDREVADA